MSNEEETSDESNSEEQGGQRRPDPDRAVRDDEDFFEDEHLFDEAEFEAEGWRIPRDPESVARFLKTFESLVPDILRRGEGDEDSDSAESLRERLKDRRLPREAVSFILGQADATKREFLRIVSREIRLFLEDVDLGGELTKILTSLSFEVRMEVRFIPNEKAFKPTARGKMRLKKRKDGAEEGDQQAERDSSDRPDKEGSHSSKASNDDDEKPRTKRRGE